MELFYCLLLGASVGLVSSFLGIGGGILIVPLLPSIAGISTKEAVATSLLIIVFVSLKNSISFWRRGLIPWAPGLSIGLGAGLATFVASLFLEKVDDRYLVMILLIVVIAIGFRLLTTRDQAELPQVTKKVFSLKAFVAGICAGVVVGFTGIGGGVLYGPILLSLHLVRGEQMSPGSNLAMFLASIFGVIGFASTANHIEGFQYGLMHIDLALMVFSAAFFSSKLGYKYQSAIPEPRRRMLLGLVLCLVFLKSLYHYLQF